MPNLVATEIDIFSIELEGGKFRDETLNFAGADTFVKGTILARRAVAIATTETMDGGNTGNGTLTLATVVGGTTVPLVGTYVVNCVELATHGGTFELVDPNGAIIIGSLVMLAGAGVTTVFEAGGLQFSITDGSTDFAVGDTGTIIVAADGDLVIFAIAGAAGAQNPIAVLTYEVTKSGSGDLPIRALVAGEVSRDRLIIDADGDGSNITDTILDTLRSAGIVATDVQQLAQFDNA